MSDGTGSGAARLAALTPAIDATGLFLWRLLLAVNLIVPVALMTAKWPKPWRGLEGEESPINWFSSVQCVVVGTIALAAYALTVVGRRAGCEPARRSWPWLMFAGGFVTMALDEQFQGHEQIRELILVPRGIFTGFDFMIPGDIVLILYVIGGLVATWFLLDELKRLPASWLLFIVAVAMIGISAVQDALAFEAMDRQSFRRVQTIVEELLEIWAQLLFATSFLLILSRKFHRLLRHVADGGTAG